MSIFKKLSLRLGAVIAISALVVAMGGTWVTSSTASAAPSAVAGAPVTVPIGGAGSSSPAVGHAARGRKELAGKLNLNTATEDQLELLPSVGPAKAERVVAWRKKNGGFKRIADLRHVKGFGYRTFKRLEPFLDIKGDNTLAPK